MTLFSAHAAFDVRNQREVIATQVLASTCNAERG